MPSRHPFFLEMSLTDSQNFEITSIEASVIFGAAFKLFVINGKSFYETLGKPSDWQFHICAGL